MKPLFYNSDDASYQAKCVLAILESREGIDSSWNQEKGKYEAKPLVARWENCREQGYVIYMRNKRGNQINIAFFEHRNSDEIAAIKWIGNTVNSPNLNDAIKEGYCSKWDINHSEKSGEFERMVDWILSELNRFW